MAKHKTIPPYKRRQRNCERLGFSNYREYLASDLWASIRIRVLRKNNYVCYRCKGKATQVHHRKYVMKAMNGENIGLLTAICAPCHKFIEWDGDRKTGICGANHRLKVR